MEQEMERKPARVAIIEKDIKTTQTNRNDAERISE